MAKRIRSLLLQFIEELACSSSDNNEIDHSRDQLASEFSLPVTVKKMKLTSQYLCCLSDIVTVVEESRSVTLRHLFYLRPKLYRKQECSNRIIAKLSRALEAPRESFHVVSNPKGIVRGNVEFLEGAASQQWFDAMNPFEQRGHMIPPLGVKSIRVPRNLKFVLVVEKETVFHKLLESGFIERHGPCIVITSKGYPDMPTRHVLSQLYESLGEQCNFYFLGDYDPHGIRIGLTYAFGPQEPSTSYYFNHSTVVKLKLIRLPVPLAATGSTNLSDADCKPLSSQDQQILTAMQQRVKKLLKDGPEEASNWMAALKEMASQKRKYELDSLIGFEKLVAAATRE